MIRITTANNKNGKIITKIVNNVVLYISPFCGRYFFGSNHVVIKTEGKKQINNTPK